MLRSGTKEHKVGRIGQNSSKVVSSNSSPIWKSKKYTKGIYEMFCPLVGAHIVQKKVTE